MRIKPRFDILLYPLVRMGNNKPPKKQNQHTLKHNITMGDISGEIDFKT